MKKYYRSKIHCFNCDAEYWTNLLKRPMPRKCKLCGSIKIQKIKDLRV